MISFLRLIRVPNILILILSLVLIQYFLVIPVLSWNDLGQSVDSISFWCVTVSAAFMMAGGFIVNDLNDLEIDAINKPGRNLINTVYSKNTALNIYIALTLTGILIGLYGGWRIHYFGMMSITPVPAVLLWFYANTFKRMPFAGNFVVAFLCGGILLLPLLFNLSTFKAEGLPVIVCSYAGFAFVLTLAREVVKDIEDIEGDTQRNCRTMPIVAGVKFSKFFTAILVAVVLVFIAWFQWQQVQSETFYKSEIYSFSYLTLLVQLPLIAFLILFFNATQKEQFHRAGNILKLVMVTGLLTILVFWWMLK
jgi:4-hydroxybenzoate polyprenyltransferase